MSGGHLADLSVIAEDEGCSSCGAIGKPGRSRAGMNDGERRLDDGLNGAGGYLIVDDDAVVPVVHEFLDVGSREAMAVLE